MQRKALDAQVIVAGGGPAGAAAAAYLAASGIDVLVLERLRFPRDKICGDFVGPVALAELRALGVDAPGCALNGNTVERAALFVDGDELITYVLPQLGPLPAYGRVIPRMVLDDAIAAAARQAGARLHEEAAVTGFRLDDDAVAVSVRKNGSEQTLRALVLVGADGSGSSVARVLHGRAPARDEFLVAARAYFTGVEGPVGRCDLSFTSDSFPGYAWIFPTAPGVANVGVGMVVETFPAATERMSDLLMRLIRIDPAMAARLSQARMLAQPAGWPLATYSGRTSPIGERIVLIGDAAGLVNPLNGEGIQAALCSARWAAETIVSCIRNGDVSKAALGRYAARLHRALGRDMLLARLVVRTVANRALNPLWLGIVRSVVTKARSDRSYADATGGVVAGVVPVHHAFAPAVLLQTGQACWSTPASLWEGLRAACRALRSMARAPGATLGWAQGTARAAWAVIAAHFGGVSAQPSGQRRGGRRERDTR